MKVVLSTVAIGWCLPAQAQVTVYEHCNFQGKAVKLNAGTYDYNAMIRSGVKNDDVSSIRVDSGYEATLYQHGGFKGRTVKATNSISCLVKNNFNDEVSSIKVVAKTTSTPTPPPSQQTDTTLVGVKFSNRMLQTGRNNGCLDFTKQKNPNGSAKVITWHECHGGNNQLWMSDGKTIRSNGKCLESNVGSGQEVGLATCNGSSKQNWFLTSENLIKSGAGKCLDQAGLDSAKKRAKVLSYSCHKGPNQRWAKPAAASAMSSITLSKLHCSNTTEVGADDGVYYKVYTDGKHTFTSGRRRMNEDMDSDEWHIENWPINKTYKYNKTLKVEFFEDDGGSGDDFLGRRTFTNYEKNGSQVVKYNDETDGRYELHVSIKAAGTSNIDGFLAPQSAFTSAVGNYSCKKDPVATRANPDPKTGSACSLPTDWKDGFINDLNNKRFHEACVTHDLCYSAPWKAAGKNSQGQDKCDTAFRRDMGDICEVIYKDRFLGDADPEMIACKATAGTMWAAVDGWGEDSYNKGQTWASSNCTVLK